MKLGGEPVSEQNQAKTEHQWEKAVGSFWKCQYQEHVMCADRNCTNCGWNPEVAAARTAAILEKMGVHNGEDA